MEKMSDLDIQDQLLKFPDWRYQNGCLEREFKFDSFAQCVTFFNFIAGIAEDLNHHPNFFNSYTFCKLNLITHDCNGISDIDFEFIGRLENGLYALGLK